MERERVRELHYIVPIKYVPSLLQVGILCKERQLIEFPNVESIANPEVQKLRAAKQIPGGGNLHSYTPLYFDARNAMMSVLRSKNGELAVIRVKNEVLEIPNVIVTDRNAAAEIAVFRPAAEGIKALIEEEVYAEWWNDSPDAKQKRCAEVLVPGFVEPAYVLGAFVWNEDCRLELVALCPAEFDVSVHEHLFFE